MRAAGPLTTPTEQLSSMTAPAALLGYLDDIEQCLVHTPSSTSAGKQSAIGGAYFVSEIEMESQGHTQDTFSFRCIIYSALTCPDVTLHFLQVETRCQKHKEGLAQY